MSKSIIIGGMVASILILAFGVYFFVRGSKPDDLNATRNKLQGDLALAEGKLVQEKQKLDNMINDIKQSFAFAVSVQEEMKQATAIVNKTNFMFKDATGVNPKLIVKNPLTGVPIEDERKNINVLLADWQKKGNISSLKLINITEGEKIQKNAETIQNYLNGLSQIMNNLTTENSGLSQFQIDTYSASVPAASTMTEIINSIGLAIQNAKTGSSQTSNTQIETPTNTPTNIGTNTSGTTSSTPPSTPAVTVDQVIAQQAAVAAAQRQVDALQAQVTQVDQQIQQSSPTTNPPPTTTTPTDTTTSPPADTPAVTSENNTINYGVTRTIDKNQGIIVQPGPPLLIPGTDPY